MVQCVDQLVGLFGLGETDGIYNQIDFLFAPQWFLSSMNKVGRFPAHL